MTDNTMTMPYGYGYDGGWLWIVVLFLLAGGNGWGWNGGNGNAAMQGSLTRAELFDGFQNQSLEDQHARIAESVNDSAMSMMQGFAGVNHGICELGHKVDTGICSVNRNIDSVRADALVNTMNITNAIHCEGEATRALITENTIQNLRDQLEAKDRELLASNLFSAQQAQTQNLVGTLRPYPQPCYITCSPYTTAANAFGCAGAGNFA